MAHPVLTAAELRSAMWLKLQAHIEQRKATLMVGLCNLNLSPEKTAVMRGRISELNQLLGLETAPATEPRRGSILRAGAVSTDEADDS
jgi:hypothetical protein